MEHTFLGTWEIVRCTFEEKTEISGLEGIKFRLDDTSDITWYNDLVSLPPESKDCGTYCDSASFLLTCETFDVNESNPHLIFGAYAGHSIEFRTNTLTPTDTLFLDCENWYVLECKRLKESQAAWHEKEFSFENALNESYFSDVIIKSSNGMDYPVHSCILRLSGFDCSMCVHSQKIVTNKMDDVIKPNLQKSQQTSETKYSNTKASNQNIIKISVTLPTTLNESNENQQLTPNLNLSPLYLQPPNEFYGIYDSVADNNEFGTNLNAHHRSHYLSSSFDCLSSNNGNGNALFVTVDNAVKGNAVGSNNMGMKRFNPTSNSDSHLEAHTNSKTIFNFCQDFMLHAMETTTVCNLRRPPLSPFRPRSPSPFPSSMDTPPSSPLTPISVLYNLPSYLLTPILHWLYTESLMLDMDEDVCRRLINFAETQPSLSKLVEPTNKYLKLVQLKKFVANIIMDLHNILNFIIHEFDPLVISHNPAAIYSMFKNCLQECAVGCAKVLQFCNIFVKDITDITRYQRNEIIKYVRTRFPIFMLQLQQLLDNILLIFMSLTTEDKMNLTNFLVPEIEQALLILKDVIEEIKNSLEKLFEDLKSLNLINKDKQDFVGMEIPNTTFKGSNKFVESQHLNLFGQTTPLTHRRRNQSLLQYSNRTENHRFIEADNDLKFVLYMHEVRKMRDIYEHILTALNIIEDKRTTFCGMDVLSKQSTIQQNLEQLIVDIPGYISIIKNLSNRLDENLDWKEFKFCFKLATSQINGIFVKLLDHRNSLRCPINKVCDLVQKKQFTMALLELGLLEPLNSVYNKLPDQENNISCCSEGLNMQRKHEFDYRKTQLNFVRHLCESPIAAQSILSKNSLRLLHSTQLSDMEFEVHTLESPNMMTDVADNVDAKFMSKNNEVIQPILQVHTFRAHRVIVSARCEWFKKALMSGMQESITRKIVITDTTPVIFRRLLLYLYGAPIDKTVGAEQICELMLLADRYSVDDLKELCENTLNSLVDEDSVLCLLGIADRYMAAALKSTCLSFLSQHANLTKLEMFNELPKTLQVEVMDLVQWFGRVSEPWNDSFRTSSNSRNSLKSPSKSRPKSRKSSPSYI